MGVTETSKYEFRQIAFLTAFLGREVEFEMNFVRECEGEGEAGAKTEAHGSLESKEHRYKDFTRKRFLGFLDAMNSNPRWIRACKAGRE